MLSAPRRARGASGAQAAILVLAFWWLATGLLLGLPRDPAGREAAAVVASLVGGSGLALAILIRRDESPRAAWLGFLAGGTLWAWVQAALYGGWLVGPGAAVATGATGNAWPDALTVLRATSWNEIASLGVLALTALLAAGAPNRMPFWTVLLFWAAHQVARLNVFFGVANLDAGLLPAHLAFLKPFFGPATNSPLLPVSVVAFLALTAWLYQRARHAGDGFRRRGRMALAVLAGLATLELLLLGVPLPLGIWAVFLSRAG